MRLFASTQTSNGADGCGDLNVHGVSMWGQASCKKLTRFTWIQATPLSNVCQDESFNKHFIIWHVPC